MIMVRINRLTLYFKVMTSLTHTHAFKTKSIQILDVKEEKADLKRTVHM